MAKEWFSPRGSHPTDLSEALSAPTASGRDGITDAALERISSQIQNNFELIFP